MITNENCSCGSCHCTDCIRKENEAYAREAKLQLLTKDQRKAVARRRPPSWADED